MSQRQEGDGVESRARLTELVEENNELRQQVHRLQGELEEYRVQLSAGHVGKAAGAGSHAVRWQVGDVVVRGLLRPGWDTIRMPDRLVRVLWSAWRGRRRM